FLPHRGISLRQRYHKGGVVWLLSVELLERVARLFSSKLCSSRIASEPLDHSEPSLSRGLGVLRIKTKLSQSTLEQSNGLTVISFESQLINLYCESFVIRCLLVYSE